MNNQEQLVKQISRYLYEYLGGESDELPEDEYDSEAGALLIQIKNGKVALTARDVSSAMQKIFEESFDYTYDEDALLEAGESIISIVKSEHHT